MTFFSISTAPLCPCLSLDRNNFGLIYLKWEGGPMLQLGAMPNLWISLQFLSPLYWVFCLMSFLLSPGSLFMSWHGGLFWLNPVPDPHCYTPSFNFLILCTSPHLLPHQILHFFPSHPHPLTLIGITLPLPPVIILFPLLSRIEASSL